MKKLLSVLLVLAVLSLPVLACAEVDLTGMSLQELIELRQQIDLLLFGSDEYKSVPVPQGTYTVGVDIPAGSYTLTSDAEWGASVECYSALPKSYDTRVYDYRVDADNTVAKITLEEGWTIVIENGTVTFSTYAGLGF